MSVESRVQEILPLLQTWWSPSITSLSLKTFIPTKTVNAQPAYPCNPRVSLPRAFLRLFRADHGHGKTICQTSFDYVLSIWIQLIQIPGEDHQSKISEAVDLFITPLMEAKFDLSHLAPWLHSLEVSQSQAVIFDELRHRFNDPTLTVSVAEINLIINGELREQ